MVAIGIAMLFQHSHIKRRLLRYGMQLVYAIFQHNRTLNCSLNEPPDICFVDTS